MSNNPKRALLVIHASSVADFRAQLDAAIAEAQPISQLPSERDGDPGAFLRALLAAAEDVVQRRGVVESASKKQAA